MLNKTARRWLRLFHLIMVANLIGGFLSIYIISTITGLSTSALFVANRSIHTLFNSLITLSFYGVVASGLVFSLFSHWEFTKHWWIIGKWVGTLVIFTLVWVWLGPVISGLVALSDTARSSAIDASQYASFQSQLGLSIFILLALLLVLIIITFLNPGV